MKNETVEAQLRQIVFSHMLRFEDHLRGNVMPGEDFDQASGYMILSIKDLIFGIFQKNQNNLREELDWAKENGESENYIRGIKTAINITEILELSSQ